MRAEFIKLLNVFNVVNDWIQSGDTQCDEVSVRALALRIPLHLCHKHISRREWKTTDPAALHTGIRIIYLPGVNE